MKSKKAKQVLGKISSFRGGSVPDEVLTELCKEVENLTICVEEETKQRMANFAIERFELLLEIWVVTGSISSEAKSKMAKLFASQFDNNND